jgi:Metallo-beta-lactamase superfamily
MLVQRFNDVSAIRDAVEIPGFGALPINAYVLHAEQPMLVDTGQPIRKQEFIDAVGSAIDLTDLRWIWLTHPDRDHMGALFDILAAAPKARLVTTFFAVGYLGVEFEVPLDRVQLVNPGESLDIGDRRLHAFRPPLFDSPMTVGFYDDKTGTCLSSDCFGGPMPDLAAAYVNDIADIAPDVVRHGQLAWASGDSPWVATVDRTKFVATYDVLRQFAPQTVLSTHLPPVRGQLDTLLGFLDEVPDIAPFVGPGQADLEQMLAAAIPAQSTLDLTTADETITDRV